MCSANCDGAAAAVVVTGEKLKTLSPEQQRRAIKITASVLTTDPWQEACQVLPDVNTLTRNAAKQAYEQAGVGPEDLDLVELHDCFATAELVHYDNLDAVPGGRRGRLLRVGCSMARRHDAGQRVRRSRSRRAIRSRRPASPTSGRSATTCAGEAGDHARSEGAARPRPCDRLASACGVHILERTAA